MVQFSLSSLVLFCTVMLINKLKKKGKRLKSTSKLTQGLLVHLGYHFPFWSNTEYIFLLVKFTLNSLHLNLLKFTRHPGNTTGSGIQSFPDNPNNAYFTSVNRWSKWLLLLVTLQKSKMASQAGLKEVVSLYQTLIKEWNRKPVDLEKVGKLLSGMKVSVDSSRPLVFPFARNKFCPIWPFKNLTLLRICWIHLSNKLI